MRPFHPYLIYAFFVLALAGLAGCDTLEDINPFNDEKEVEGIVEAIGDDALTVDGIEYLVTDATEFEGDLDGLDDLDVGDAVEIEYEEAGAGRIALEIERAGGDGGEEDDFEITYAPAFNPAAMQREVTNPFFPLTPGTVWEYEAETDEGTERIVVEVLEETREVAGVTVTVVRDQVFLDGDLIEDTDDWYAQDADGNVWYMGEDSKEVEDGQVVGTAGSWEAGVDGARAGILMPADPVPGQAYQQEFYAGEAEDRGRVLSVGESVSVPAGDFDGCIRTEDTTPLEPDVEEHKFYCPGIGTVLEVDLEDGVRVELISVEQ